MLEDKASVKEKDRVINAIEAAEYLMNTTQVFRCTCLVKASTKNCRYYNGEHLQSIV